MFYVFPPDTSDFIHIFLFFISSKKIDKRASGCCVHVISSLQIVCTRHAGAMLTNVMSNCRLTTRARKVILYHFMLLPVSIGNPTAYLAANKFNRRVINIYYR